MRTVLYKIISVYALRCDLCLLQDTKHCLTVNLTTLRVWCYTCSKEVFLDRKLNGQSANGKPQDAAAATQVLRLRFVDVWYMLANPPSLLENLDTPPPCSTTLTSLTVHSQIPSQSDAAPPPFTYPISRHPSRYSPHQVSPNVVTPMGGTIVPPHLCRQKSWPCL